MNWAAAEVVSWSRTDCCTARSFGELEHPASQAAASLQVEFCCSPSVSQFEVGTVCVSSMTGGESQVLTLGRVSSPQLLRCIWCKQKRTWYLDWEMCALLSSSFRERCFYGELTSYLCLC